MAPKFSLQSVLDYRHNRVELIEVEFGRLVQSHRQSHTFLDVLQDSRTKVFDQMTNAQTGDLDLFMLSNLRSSLKVINDRIVQQQFRLQELAAQMEVKRSEMVAARQEEQALVTLKNKEIERYQQEQQQVENRMQDDIYISRAYQRTVGAA